MQDKIYRIDLSPEREFLLWTLRVKDGDREESKVNDRIREHLDRGMDWSLLRQMAVYHGVLPLFYKRLGGLDEGVVPAGEKERLRSLFLINAQHNLRFSQKLVRVWHLLSGRGIEAVPIKGPDLAIRAYGDVCLRSFGDLDFLVRSRDLPAIFDTLTEAGYRPAFPPLVEMKRLWPRSGRDFRFLDDTCSYDFHQRLTQGPRSFDPGEKVWQNLSTLQLDSRQIPVLSPEHTLLALSLHGTKHGWDSLKWVADFAHFVRAHPGIDWSGLQAEAKSRGCLRILRMALRLSGELCGLTLPAGLKQEILQDRLVETRTTRFKNRLLGGPGEIDRLSRFMNIPRCLDSLGHRFPYLGYYTFTPSEGDAAAFGLPPRLYLLYYFLRPFRQFFKLAGKLLGVIFTKHEKK